MPKNIYTINLEGNMSVTEKAKSMTKALDTSYLYTHSENLGSEITIRENYYLYGKDEYLLKGVGPDLYNLSKRNDYFKQKQAKYILMELAKLTPREEYFSDMLDTFEGLHGDNFMANFEDIITDPKTNEKIISDDDINRIFAESEEIDLKYEEYEIEEETLAADKKIIEFNDPSNVVSFAMADGLAITSVVKSLGYEVETINQSLNNIKNAPKENLDAVTEKEYKKLLENHLSTIDPSELTEERTILEMDKLTTIFKNYGSERTGINLVNPLRTMMEKDGFVKYVKDKATPEGLIKFLNNHIEDFRDNNIVDRDNTRDKYAGELLKVIKYVQTMHANRSLFTRFIDWFKPNGEYRTINKAINTLKNNGYTSEKINEALRNTDGALEDTYDDTAAKFVERIGSEASALYSLPSTLNKSTCEAIEAMHKNNEYLDELKTVANNYSDLSKQAVNEIEDYQNNQNQPNVEDDPEAEEQRENIHVYEVHDEMENDDNYSELNDDDSVSMTFDDPEDDRTIGGRE